MQNNFFIFTIQIYTKGSTLSITKKFLHTELQHNSASYESLCHPSPHDIPISNVIQSQLYQTLVQENNTV